MHFELKNAEQLWLFRIFISSKDNPVICTNSPLHFMRKYALQTFFTEEQVSTLAERLYQIYTTDMDGKPDRSKRLNEIEK